MYKKRFDPARTYTRNYVNVRLNAHNVHWNVQNERISFEASKKHSKRTKSVGREQKEFVAIIKHSIRTKNVRGEQKMFVTNKKRS